MKREWVRRMGGAVLLAILAACALVGSSRQPQSAVSVMVSRAAFELPQEDAVAGVQARLAQERAREMALLDQVVASEETTAQNRADASAQRLDLAQRMEQEAAVDACLAQLGYAQTAVIAGGGGLTVFLPHDALADETEKNRVIDALCGVTGIQIEDLKIILTKK